MVHLDTGYLNLTDVVSGFSFLKQPYQKVHHVVVEKMGWIICLHQANTTTKAITETTKTRVKAVRNARASKLKLKYAN